MGLGMTVLLGLVAGGTILIGLPVGRLRNPAPAVRLLLNAIAVGVLLFLTWDVLSAAWSPIEQALVSAHDGTGGLAGVLGYGGLFAGGLTAGLLALIGYEHWIARRMQRATAAAAGQDRPLGPGAMHAAELAVTPNGLAGWSPARQLALLIAVGIGMHNFAEGLAIGQSAASGEIALATLLVIGFGLHNATEGFGIVAPLAGDTTPEGHRRVPSWRFLLALGTIGGGPTFLGTVVGHSVVSEPVSVLFLTLAGGSILYVVLQLLAVASRARRTDLLAYGLLIGLVAGFATDAVVTLAGA